MSTTTPPSLSPGTANPSPTPQPTMSRLELKLKTLILRFFQTIGRLCDHYLSPPQPSRPSFTIKIPSTVASVKGNIPLLFYTPKSYSRKQKSKQQEPLLPQKKFPVLINFHGGGYTIGHPADDARWATEVINHPTIPAVVVSVGYRLAPSYPFPTGIEDCVSAILYLWQHAEELNLDISRTALSGFSAGASFCFTASYRLHSELQRLKEEDKLHDVEIGKIVSLITFYPPLDWTKTREERAATNPNFKPMIPPFFVNVIEESYLFPRPEDLSIPLLSPALASDELVLKALPERLVMVTCWGDGLLGEGEAFRERLKKLGKTVEGYTVPGALHGWDKWPAWRKGNSSRDEAYAKAGEWLVEHIREAS